MKENNKKEDSKKEKPIDFRLKIFTSYIATFEPAISLDATVRKTSSDIVDDLMDVLDVKVNVISSMMSDLGFNLEVEDSGRIVWLMKKRISR